MATTTPIYYFDVSKKGIDLIGTRDVPVLTNEQAVKESLYNLLLTETGTKVMDPLYGLDLEQYLFEPNDDMTAEAMQYDIMTGIQAIEDRINNLEVIVVPDEDEKANSYVITINFTVIFSNVTQTLQVDFNKIR